MRALGLGSVRSIAARLRCLVGGWSLVAATTMTLLAQERTPPARLLEVHVFDSVHRHPLAGAIVTVRNGERTIAEDASSASGVATFAGLSSGSVEISIRHPLLDSLGLSLSQAHALTPTSTNVIALAVPAEAGLAAALCDSAAPRGSGAIIGRVGNESAHIDPPALAADTAVFVQWAAGDPAREGIHIQRRIGFVDPHGRFRICGLPLGQPIVTWVGELSSEETAKGFVLTAAHPIRYEFATVAFTVIDDPTNPPAQITVVTRGLTDDSAVAHTNRSIGGSIVSHMGRGLSHVAVAWVANVRSTDDLRGKRLASDPVAATSKGTTSDEGGRFSISNADDGQLHVQGVGWRPLDVSIGPASPTDLIIPLLPVSQPLAMLSSGRATDWDPAWRRAFGRIGFLDRRKAYTGEFVAEADLRAMLLLRFTDLFKRSGIVRVSAGDTLVSAQQDDKGRFGCAELFLDGARQDAAYAGCLNANSGEIAALEIYRPGAAPKQFANGEAPSSAFPGQRSTRDLRPPACAVVAVWTKTYVGALR